MAEAVAVLGKWYGQQDRAQRLNQTHVIPRCLSHRLSEGMTALRRRDARKGARLHLLFAGPVAGTRTDQMAFQWA